MTPITLTGVLNPLTSGTHQIVLKIYDAASGTALGGDARFVDVGGSIISSLTTDRGVYTPQATSTVMSAWILSWRTPARIA